MDLIDGIDANLGTYSFNINVYHSLNSFHLVLFSALDSLSWVVYWDAIDIMFPILHPLSEVVSTILMR